MHLINQKKFGIVGEMALKLDMSKAYDRVEWTCLESIMRKMGVHQKMIEVIMRCITTVTYSIRINGQTRGRIVPSRGLRQGDPLSPYLFLFCAEGLSALLRRAAERQNIHGVAVCQRAQEFPICSLLMIAWFFVEHHWKNVMSYSVFSLSMKLPPVSNSIKPKLPYSSVKILHGQYRKK